MEAQDGKEVINVPASSPSTPRGSSPGRWHSSTPPNPHPHPHPRHCLMETHGIGQLPLRTLPASRDHEAHALQVTGMQGQTLGPQCQPPC